MANRFFPNYPTYRITSRFGMRTLKGTTKMHNGIDLVATKDGKTGQTDYITAHTGGTVHSVGYGDSQGNYIKIQVDPKTIMVYYHLKEKPDFKKGDSVKTGQRIGYMGATGNVTGAHLHWGIQVDGTYIDPEPYLDKDYGETEEAAETVNVPLPILRRGDKTTYVRTMQALLIVNGYDVGSHGIDGSFGPATQRAINKLQSNKNLSSRAMCGLEEWEELMKV